MPVRRWRRAATGVATVLAMVVLAPSSAAQVIPAADAWRSLHTDPRPERCPASAFDPNNEGWRSGDLAAPGAFAATLCTYGSHFSLPGRPVQEEQILTHGMNRLLRTLGELPRIPKGDFMCAGVGTPEFNLILTYRDRPPSRVDLDLGCGLAVSRTTIRGGARTVLNAYFRLYREQVAATVDRRALKAVVCPARLEVSRMVSDRLDFFPVDQTIRGFAESPPLPATLAVATACRYLREGASLRLVRQVSTRDDLQSLRRALNKSPMTKDSGNCGRRKVVSRLDVVWTTDVTGAVQETRVRRAPCTSVGRGVSDATLRPALSSLLDRLLA